MEPYRSDYSIPPFFGNILVFGIFDDPLLVFFGALASFDFTKGSAASLAAGTLEVFKLKALPTLTLGIFTVGLTTFGAATLLIYLLLYGRINRTV